MKKYLLFILIGFTMYSNAIIRGIPDCFKLVGIVTNNGNKSLNKTQLLQQMKKLGFTKGDIVTCGSDEVIGVIFAQFNTDIYDIYADSYNRILRIVKDNK